MRMQYQWLGKLLGSLLGYFLTQHWAGMLIGMFLGHAYDLYRTQTQMLESAVRFNQGWRFGQSDNKSVQSGFMQALFFVLGKLSKCDGRVTAAEIAWAERLMQRLYLSPDQRQEAIKWFNQGKQPEMDVEPLLRDFARFAVPFGLNTLFLELMVECALSDGALHPAERALLLSCAERLKLPAWRIDEVVRRVSRPGYRASATGAGGRARADGATREQTSERTQTHRQRSGEALHMAYETLGVTEGASRAEVKRAYRRLMSRHHPDKLMARGAPEPMLNLAKEKTQAIQKAFELIGKARGYK
ncbi:MAG: co-chaperone DjlA [Gammaproteobacteria bacterium]